MHRKLFFSYLIPFVYSLFFTAAVTAMVWLALNYASLNFITIVIGALVAFYAIAAVAACINLCKKNNFLNGSSVDVLSIKAQKTIRSLGILLALPGLLYAAVFGYVAASYNGDLESTDRALGFANFELAVFGKSVIFEYAGAGKVLVSPQPYTIPGSSWTYEPAPREISAEPEEVGVAPDYGAYMARLQRKIKHHWFPPKGDESLRARVVFQVAKDGAVSHLRLVNSTGNAIADQAALKAIESCGTFATLPEGSPESVDIEFTFDYNVFNNVDNSLTPVDSFSSSGLEASEVAETF